MIDWNVCLTGLCAGMFGGCVSALLNYIISALFSMMQG